MFIPTGNYPKYDECSFGEWKKFFEDYPEWIEEVSVTGGETTLHPDLSKIVNYLIDTGRHVCLMTNLKRPEEILKIKKSWRLYVLAAYHETDDLKRFDKAYNLIKDHLRVEVIEFTEKRLLPYSRLRETMSRECLLDLPALNFAPNSPRTKRMYTSCYNTFLDGTKAVCPNCGGTNLDGNYCRTCSYRM
jgi:hypothetical protein